MGWLTRHEAQMLISKSSKYSHSILVSRIMSTLAERFKEDQDEWVIAGLLHDLDYDIVDGSTDKHGLVAASQLDGKVPGEVLHAIKAHDHRTGIEPLTLLDKSLKFADALAVLIEDQVIQSEVNGNELTRLMASESQDKPWIEKIIDSFCAEYNITVESLLIAITT